MPFVTDPNARVAPLVGAADMDFSGAEDPDFWRETMPAAFRLENVIGSTIAEQQAESFERNPIGQPIGLIVEDGFDPLSEENIAGYERHANLFGHVLTSQQSDALKANIDREEADRQIIESSGGLGFVAQLAAGVIDPTVLIPVGGQIRKGQSLLRIAVNAGIAAGVSTVPQEVVLQESQALRTNQESFENVAGATFLGGILGGAAGAFVNLGKAGRQVDEFMVMPDSAEPDWGSAAEAVRMTRADLRNSTSMTQPEPASAGAAAVQRLGLDQQRIDGVANRAIARAANAMPYVASEPVTRSLMSDSLAAREAIESLADIASPLVKNNARMETRTLPDGTTEEYLVWGRATRQSVESDIKRYDRMLGQGSETLSDFHMRYLRRDTSVGSVSARMRSLTGAVPEGKMTRPDFGEAVIQAMRRGDQSDVPEVQEAAQRLRAEFFEPLRDQAVELGMFGYDMVPDPANPDGAMIVKPRVPDVGDTAQSHVTRVYNRDRVERRRPEFANRLLDHFRLRRSQAQESLTALASDVDMARQAMEDSLGELRAILRERNHSVRDARAAVSRAEANNRIASRREREASTQSAAAERRANTVDREQLTPVERAYWSGFRRDIARGRGEDRPISLSEWVKAQGGIRDPLESGFDLSHLRQPGLLNYRQPKAPGARSDVEGNPVGLPADLLREAAVEMGYLDESASLVDFVDALTNDVSGRPVYSRADDDLVGHMEYLQALASELSDEGLDVQSMSPEEMANWFTSKNFRRITRFQAGRISEARLREEQAGRRLRAAQDALEESEVNLDDAQALLRTAREMGPELTERANAMRAAHRQSRQQYELAKKDFELAEFRAEKSDEDLLGNVNSTIDNILGGPEGRLGADAGAGSSRRMRIGSGRNDHVGLSGIFKARVLDIPDVEIEDFLESDANHIMRSTLRSIAPDVELIKRFGSIDMDGKLRQIVREFDEMAMSIDPANEREMQGLARKKRRAIDDIMGVRDRLRGTYGTPTNPNSAFERGFRIAKSLNVLRLMGSVIVSSVPDASRAVLVHGLRNTLSAPMSALTGRLSAIRGLDAELKAAGTGYEIALNSRMMAMSDVLDDYGRYTKLERMVQGTQGHFGFASLIAPWNRVMKSIAGYGVQNRVMRIVQAVSSGEATSADANLLSRIGISQDDAIGFAKQFRQHGNMDGGNFIANSGAWDNPYLRERWLNAIRAEVDRLVVTPGQDRPLLSSTTVGGVLMQFRSYNFAATQRVLMAYSHGALTARDAHVVMALITQIGLGAIVAKIKAEQYGLDTSDWSQEKWLVEGIDRSGVLGAFADANMMLEYASSGALGLSALAGDERLSRMQSRNAVGQLMGPSFGGVLDAIYGVSGLVGNAVPGGDDDELKRGHIRSLRRLVPFQNVFYVRRLFDELEDSTGDALGAEGDSLADRRARQ